MLVGIEIEFLVSKDGSFYGDKQELIVDYINNLNIGNIRSSQEWYSHMIEITFTYPTTTIEQVKDMINKVEDRYSVKLIYETTLAKEPTTYNGLHLHTMCMPYVLEKHIELIENNLSSSKRFLHSHHIWGGFGHREYRDWQKSNRYLPVNPNKKSYKPNTFEIRAFNCSNLEDDFKMFKAVHESINMESVTDEDVFIKLDNNYFYEMRNKLMEGSDD